MPIRGGNTRAQLLLAELTDTLSRHGTNVNFTEAETLSSPADWMDFENNFDAASGNGEVK
jgi:hypothetical protein